MEKEDEPEEAAAEAFFSPYPELQKKSSLRAKRRQKNLRANTWKELLREREGVFYVKSFERVCDMCRLSQDDGSCRGGAPTRLADRKAGRAKENATTFAESVMVGARDEMCLKLLIVWAGGRAGGREGGCRWRRQVYY